MEERSFEFKTMDLNGMAARVREMIEEIDGLGVSPEKVKEIRALVQKGKIGEAYCNAGVLKNIAEEMRPEAAAKKLLQVLRRAEHCLIDIAELSRTLADFEIWQHHRTLGYESFDSFSIGFLHLPAKTVRALAGLKDSLAFVPGELDVADVLNALLRVAQSISKADGKEDGAWK